MAEKKEIKKIKRAALYLSTADVQLLRRGLCVYSTDTRATEDTINVMTERLAALDRVIDLMPDNL